MTDISKCSGEGCEQKEKCYRFTTIADELWQSYFTEPPIKDGECEYFWANNNYRLNNEKHTQETTILEEAKQRAKNYMSLKGALEPKMETLEEVAENYGNSIGNKNGTAQFDFIRGAKWMEERMYSEEEVIKIVEKSRATGLTAEYFLLTEQFKKKQQ